MRRQRFVVEKKRGWRGKQKNKRGFYTSSGTRRVELPRLQAACSERCNDSGMAKAPRCHKVRRPEEVVQVGSGFAKGVWPPGGHGNALSAHDASPRDGRRFQEESREDPSLKRCVHIFKAVSADGPTACSCVTVCM